MAMLSALQRYVRNHFTNPQRGTSTDEGKSKPAQGSNQPSKKVGALYLATKRCCTAPTVPVQSCADLHEEGCFRGV